MLKKDEEDQSKKELLDVLQRNIDYMKNLVVKTIELAQLNTQKKGLKLEDVNIDEIIQKIIKSKKAIIEKMGINIQYISKCKKPVLGNKLALEELITNIIENSIKYNKKDGTIKIETTKDNNYLKAMIKDSGIGMTKIQIDQIFNEFYKADESRHNFESSGLGMTIAKRIVDLHHGKIWVESEGLNKGTTVYFTLHLKI